MFAEYDWSKGGKLDKKGFGPGGTPRLFIMH